ncbi:PQQ-binding-like beta-propeller repeat protein [Lacipirellula parvula]|uniref:Pyrrolo-quinoline quinone repeat domain-containing protein n=1 Tax=Lacipirellula parvula TaxID=2650471 RepID=A0A5K7XGQ0_9BACT|nr:PQQ-binding-like beta-propeller repeat protein [Lacipirellula parvula]BBO33466.1 hypothetical protein PLANPX_3078 [Lacipirellula parvula]
MISTEDFITLLEQRALVAASVTRQLRAKSEQGDSRITPKSILKYLVKKELVTRDQAKELLETTLTVSDKAESSILGLSPLPDEIIAKSAERLTPQSERPTPEAEPEPLVPPAAFSGDLFDADEPVPLMPALDDDGDQLTADETDGESEAKPSRRAAGSMLRSGSGRKPKAKKSTPKKTKTKAKDGSASQWDSPLLLIGGGALAVMAVGSIVLWWLLFRETADKALVEAEDAFKQGNYAAATVLYQDFVTKYAHHKDVSEAKVRVNLSQLWQKAEAGDFSGAAEAAPGLITAIENEPAFISNEEQTNSVTQAKQDLSSLLPRIAQGLAGQADRGGDDAMVAERLKQAENVLAMASNTKYIPEELRKLSEIAAIQETLALAKSRLQRKVDLAEALKQMEAVTAEGKPAEALKIRDTLLLTHASLDGDPALVEMVAKVGVAEQAAIKFVEQRQAAIVTPAKSDVIAEVALADRRGPAAEGAATPFVVRIDGGLYGMSSRDGSLLWRRFVGFGSTSQPVVLPSGLVAAADAQRNELVAVQATTGKLAWRLPLEGKLATPVTLGERLLVSSEAGRVYVIDQASGEMLGFVQFPQPIRQPPAVNERGDRIYVLGEHSNLYTLSADKFACVGVYYLGHAAGGAATPPIAILNKVVVADNSGAETCQVRVIALNDQGAANADAAKYRLSGLVTTPLQSAGRRFATVTTQGQAVVFEVSAANDKSSLTALASREAQDREQLARFSVLHDGHLWLAARELTKLAILPTGNQLPVRSIARDYRGDVFDYPLQTLGNLIVHVRRPSRQAGAIVAAMDVAANKTLWETAIAVPAAGAPVIDASTQQVVAGSSSGAVYVLDQEALVSRVQNEALHLETTTLRPPVFNDALDLGSGRLALAGDGADQIIHFKLQDPRQQLRSATLPGPLSGKLAAWGDSFAAPSEVGQICLYNADDSAPLGAPFQAELTPGQKFRWLAPAAIGDSSSSELIVSDGVSKVYLLRRVAEPENHLEAAASVDVGPSPLNSPFAAVGSTAFVGNEAGRLARFTVPDLAPGEATDLGGRVTWGPFAVAKGVVVATDANELLLVSVDGAVVWRQKLAHGALTGKPLIDNGQAYLLYGGGGVSKISLADGAEASYVDVGQTLTAGPVPYGKRLLVTAADGTLLVVEIQP